jgi:hypothetical protein
MQTVKTKIQCAKCLNLFSKKGGNYNKHVAKCIGTYAPFAKLSKCKYCDLIFSNEMTSSFRANHSRWCIKNPKRQDYVNLLKNNGNVEAMNNARKKSGMLNQYVKARLENRDIPESPNKGKPGSFLGKNHTYTSKELIRQKALSSKHRRLVRSITKYEKLDGSIVILDSSWEVALAKRLDKQNIEWIRPEPLEWSDENGIIHNYFPDFYLPKFDVYLDPKNPQAIKVQKNKLQILLKQYSNIVILSSLEECIHYTPRGV